MTADNAEFRSPPPRRLVVILAAVAILIAVAIAVIKSPAAMQPLDSLAAFVGSEGKLEPLRTAAGRFFGIPGESIVFTTCSVVSESGRMRSIGVRPRPHSDYIDILLVEAEAGGEAANYFLTSRAGKLIKAAHLDTQITPIDAAVDRFNHDLGFWQTWRREKAKHDAK